MLIDTISSLFSFLYETDETKTEDKPHEETPLMDSKDDTEDEKQSEPNLPLAYIFFQVHTLIAVISLALISIAQYLPPPHHRPILFTYLIHFYMVLVTSIGIIIELEWLKWLINQFLPALKNWIVRGFLYIFIAMFSIEESTVSHGPPKKRIYAPPADPDAVATKKFFLTFGARLSSMILWIGGIGTLYVGTLYVLMGLLFLERLKKKSEENYERRKNDALGVENEESDGEQA